MARIPELYVKPLHGEPYRFSIEKDVITIGRSKKNDLVLADQWLSRIHAEIRRENARHFIRDLDSRNGTYVNGMRLSQRVPLQNGDVVTLGDQQIRFVHDASGSVVLTETPGGSTWRERSWSRRRSSSRRRERRKTPGTTSRETAGRGRRLHSLADDSARILKQNQILSALERGEHGAHLEPPAE